jgi:hypothetical protein
VNTNSPPDTGAILSAINELGAPAVLALLQTVSECKLRGETFEAALCRTRDELQTSAYLLFEPQEVAALDTLLEACTTGSFPLIVSTALAAEALS